MKKIILISCVFMMLLGCQKENNPIEKTIPTPRTEEKVCEVIDVAQQMENIEGVLEQELPQTLEVTIQDITVIFTKDKNYHSDDILIKGDMIVVYYIGELSNHPQVRLVEKK